MFACASADRANDGRSADAMDRIILACISTDYRIGLPMDAVRAARVQDCDVDCSDCKLAVLPIRRSRYTI